MNLPFVVLPQRYAELIAESGDDYGALWMQWNGREHIGVVDGFRQRLDGSSRKGLSDVPQRLHLADARSFEMGRWFRVDAQLHLQAYAAHLRRHKMRLDAFQELALGPWFGLARGAFSLAVTVTELPDDRGLDFAAWRLLPDENTAELVSVEIVPEEVDLLEPVEGTWPITELASKTVIVLGAGSIGGAVAQSLAGYGLRTQLLVDPDRLTRANFARHVVHPRNLGRHKAMALADHLRDRDDSVRAEPLMLNVIYDADDLRPALEEADIVVVATDGVASRRAADYLARRAGKPAVFACVLADGAFGEILRIRPPRTGCLLCVRRKMIDAGAMNPEPSLDRGYGTGSPHLPMTAVRGDLELVSQLAAKATVATLLEPLGYREQRLPGNQAIIGLRPKPGMAVPFDIEHAGEVRWHDLPAPREDCPNCGSRAPRRVT